MQSLIWFEINLSKEKNGKNNFLILLYLKKNLENNNQTME